MYSGTPDDTYSYSVAPAYDPSYVGGNAQAEEAAPARKPGAPSRNTSIAAVAIRSPAAPARKSRIDRPIL